MSATRGSKSGPGKGHTTVERRSDREVIVTRTINGPARIVFEAFTKAELFTIDEKFGGWQSAQEKFFSEGGIFDQICQPGS